MKLYILNGPNINMLGVREPDIYGKTTYAQLVEKIKIHCDSLGIKGVIFQSNCEGELVDMIQKSYFDKADGIVINPAGYTHTSVAILDAVKAVGLPCVEVHISDVDKREEFRQISYIRSACVKTISGQGIDGYIQAIDFLFKELKD